MLISFLQKRTGARVRGEGEEAGKGGGKEGGENILSSTNGLNFWRHHGDHFEDDV